MFSTPPRSPFPLATAIIFAVVLSAVTYGFAGISSPSARADTVGVSLQLLEMKASQQGDPRASVSIVEDAEPGTSLDRRVRVTNSSDVATAVQLYSTEATIEDGTFTASASQNNLGRWITTSETNVTLAPASSVELTVTIDIPADAAPGEQYAAIWAEVRSAPDAATNIVSANRAGLRVYLLVGGDNATAAAFSIDSVSAGRSAQRQPTVRATITNTGGRAIEFAGTLVLTDGPGGLSAGPLALDSTPLLAPGETGRVTVTLDPELPDGPWDAKLTLTGSMVTQEFSGAVSFDGVVVPDQGFPYWAWIVIVGALLAALVGGLAVRWRRGLAAV